MDLDLQQFSRRYFISRNRLDKARIELASAAQCLATATEELREAEHVYASVADIMVAAMEVGQRVADERISGIIDAAQTGRNNAQSDLEDLRARLMHLEGIARLALATRQPHTCAEETGRDACPCCRADHDLGVALMSLPESGAPMRLRECEDAGESVPTRGLTPEGDRGQ